MLRFVSLSASFRNFIEGGLRHLGFSRWVQVFVHHRGSPELVVQYFRDLFSQTPSADCENLACLRLLGTDPDVFISVLLAAAVTVYHPSILRPSVFCCDVSISGHRVFQTDIERTLSSWRSATGPLLLPDMYQFFLALYFQEHPVLAFALTLSWIKNNVPDCYSFSSCATWDTATSFPLPVTLCCSIGDPQTELVSVIGDAEVLTTCLVSPMTPLNSVADYSLVVGDEAERERMPVKKPPNQFRQVQAQLNAYCKNNNIPSAQHNAAIMVLSSLKFTVVNRSKPVGENHERRKAKFLMSQGLDCRRCVRVTTQKRIIACAADRNVCPPEHFQSLQAELKTVFPIKYHEGENRSAAKRRGKKVALQIVRNICDSGKLFIPGTRITKGIDKSVLYSTAFPFEEADAVAANFDPANSTDDEEKEKEIENYYGTRSPASFVTPSTLDDYDPTTIISELDMDPMCRGVKPLEAEDSTESILQRLAYPPAKYRVPLPESEGVMIELITKVVENKWFSCFHDLYLIENRLGEFSPTTAIPALFPFGIVDLSKLTVRRCVVHTRSPNDGIHHLKMPTLNNLFPGTQRIRSMFRICLTEGNKEVLVRPRREHRDDPTLIHALSDFVSLSGDPKPIAVQAGSETPMQAMLRIITAVHSSLPALRGYPGRQANGHVCDLRAERGLGMARRSRQDISLAEAKSVLSLDIFTRP